MGALSFPKENYRSVLHMEEEDDVLIKIVRRALKGRPCCVKHMGEENDAPIPNVRQAL